MSIRLRGLAAAGALLLFSALASASTRLTLEEALGAILQHNPEIATARQQRAIAAAEVRVAGMRPNPEAAISTGNWQSRTGATSRGTAAQLGLSQLVELPAVRASRARAAQHGVSAADFNADGVRVDVGFDARTAFFDLLKRQEDGRLAAENLALLTAIQARVRSRVAVGEAPKLELVRAESEVLAARTAAESANLQIEEARGLLRRLSGNALPPQFEAVGSLPALPALPEFSMLQQQLLDANPRLKALNAEYDRMRARVDHERALRTPQPTISLMQAQDPETRQTLVGVGLPLPLWNRREGQIALAQSHADLALTQIDAQRAQLLRELDAAYARASIMQRQVQTFEGGLLASAEAALKVAESAWRFGERGFLEVLDAQRTLRSVRRDYNQARFERHAAWMALERLQGKDPFGKDKL